MRAITPIISILMLLLISIALATTAFSFLQGILFPQISKSFTIPKGSSYCTPSIQGQSTIKIYVVNTGYRSSLHSSSLGDGDFILAAIDGNNVLSLMKDASIPSGDSGLILDYDCASLDCNGNSCCSSEEGSYNGYHSVSLGTTSIIEHTAVYCP